MKVGDRIGKLLLIERQCGQRAGWFCQCDCGNQKFIREDSLQSGSTVSCGCFSAEQTSKRSRTHGATKTSGYASWHSMMLRCYDPDHDNYASYGGRGITVCAEWHDAGKFLADMGSRGDGLQIDRIDVNGNYEPGNCRWATFKENMNNKRNTRYLTVGGVTRPASEWADITGVSMKTLHTRLLRGWPHDRAIQSTNFREKQNNV